MHKFISELKYKLLIFDEDFKNAKKIKLFFQRYEYFIKTENEIDLKICKMIQPDFIIINISTLTKRKNLLMDGLFNEFKGRYIILTHINNIPDRDIIKYIESGAADVLDQTTRLRLLLAKIRLILVTHKINNNYESMNFDEVENNVDIGAIKLNKTEGKLTYKKHRLDFSTNEFSLLMMLVERQNKIISRDILYKVLLNSQYDGVNRSIDNTVFRIRKKMEKHGITQFKIKSIRGRGYLFLNLEN